MLYKIVPRNSIASIIDAESPEAAMSEFAWAMDSDMNCYFTAIPVTDPVTEQMDYLVYDEGFEVEIERDGEYMIVPFCEIQEGDYIIHAEKYAGDDAHKSEDPDYDGWVVYDSDGDGIFPEDLGAPLK